MSHAIFTDCEGIAAVVLAVRREDGKTKLKRKFKKKKEIQIYCAKYGQAQVGPGSPCGAHDN
jgi:hypothetical protein